MLMVFSRDDTFQSWAIRAATQDEISIRYGYSHVAMVTLDGKHVIDSMKGKGVRAPRNLNEYLSHLDTYTIGQIRCPDEETGEAWALNQIGKGYDYSAFWAFALGPLMGLRNWQEDDRYVCSEFAATRLLHSGVLMDEPLSYVSPNRLARLSGAV